jgi:hypothetical protein
MTTPDPRLQRAQFVADWLSNRFAAFPSPWLGADETRLAAFHADIILDEWMDSPPVRALGIRLVVLKPEWNLAPKDWWTTEKPEPPKQETEPHA